MTSTPGSESNDRLSVVYSFPHALGAPGIGWTAWNQVVELIAAGHRVHLVVASLARPVPGAAGVRRTLELSGVRIPHRALGRDRALARHDRIAAAVVRSVRPDVVHAWPLAARRTLAAAAGIGAAGLREAPNTHTAHAYRVVAEECARLGVVLPATASHAENARHLAIEQQEWDAATAVLVPSAPVEQSFLDRGHPAERLQRHRYGYRPGTTLPRTVPDDGPLTVLFLGRVEPRKGLHYALEAWRDSTAAGEGRFLIFGDVVPSYGAFLAPLLDQPGVELHPFTREPAAALAAAHALVLPTIEEGSALVSYEAQAAGCIPLVSTAAGAVLEDGVHGLLHAPRDVDALRRQFELLHERPAERRRLAAAAAAHAPELSWAAAGVALVAAYRAALRGVRADAVAR
ncbi:glycosyltransferase [Protaetiibacter larvae]|nr:glycosyltransferase [Protaetiibacter larvae]